MLHIDLVYARDDAEEHHVRTALQEALHLLDLPPKWDEWSQSDPALPKHAVATVVPAVFVEGRPVSTSTPPNRAAILLHLQEHIRQR